MSSVVKGFIGAGEKPAASEPPPLHQYEDTVTCSDKTPIWTGIPIVIDDEEHCAPGEQQSGEIRPRRMIFLPVREAARPGLCHAK